MKYIALVLMLIANATYANIPSTTTMDKINWEVNLKFGNIPDNCLIVAKEKQRLILKMYGIEAKILVIQPRFATMKHAVLDVDGKILDNGDIANHIFDRDELRYFGRIL